MNHSPADVVRSLLVSLGTLTFPVNNQNWPGYVSYLPDIDKNSACLYDTQGHEDGRIMRSGQTIRHPGVQVLVRSDDYRNGFHKAKAVSAAFDNIHRDGVIIGSSTYTVHSVRQVSDIVSLGQIHLGFGGGQVDRIADEKRSQRETFTLNTTVTITTESSPVPEVSGMWTSEIPAGTINGSNRIFTVVDTPSSALTFLVYLNGLLIQNGVSKDYVLSGSTITFNVGLAPITGDVIYALYTHT